MNGFDFGNVIITGSEVLKGIIDEILVKFRPRMSLEDMQRVYVNILNKVILEEEYKSDAKYVGGIFQFDYVDDKSYTCGFNLYFQDKNKKIIEINSKSRPLNIAKLSDDLIATIKAEKIVKFEIPEPADDVRNQYDYEHFNSSDRLKK